MAARSFSTTLALADDLARPLAEAKSGAGAASGGLVFVSGALTQQVTRVAEQVRAAWKGVPACVVPAAGVLTERGELEGVSAASGVLWTGGSAAAVALADAEAPSGPAIAEALAQAAGAPQGAAAPASARRVTCALFARPESFSADVLEGLCAAAPGLWIFGAGTVGGSAAAVTAGGKIVEGSVAGLVLMGLAPPIVEASPACKLLSDFQPIDEASGGLVLRVGGRSALDLLSSVTAEMAKSPGAQPLVLAALAEDDPEGRERFVIRPVRGIDPTRRAVMIGREARPGVRFAFGVRDAAAARAGLESAARTAAQQALGAAPRFAIYLSCAGRGQGLYGVPDVEARILRQRFGDLPIAGMHSSFEIAPRAPGDARLALYTGVLALFRSPS